MVLPKFLFFDLDNTILDFYRSEREAVAKTLMRAGAEPTPERLKRYSELNDEQWKLLEKGLVSREVLKVRRFENLFREFGIAYPAEEAAVFYENRLGEGAYFLPGAEELLEQLSAVDENGRRQHLLYVVSNGTLDVQRSRIRLGGLTRFFEAFFISEEIGFDKPDRKFFDYVFSQIEGFEREDAAVIGDSLSSDIQGGINAGVQTIWYNPDRKANHSAIRPDREIYALSELIKM